MKKFIITLFLAVLSQQSLAVTVAAGIEFLDTADTLDTSTSGDFETNYQTTGKTPEYSGIDGNAATFTAGVFSSSQLDPPTTLGVSFGSGASIRTADVADVNLTILFVGSNPHTGLVSLFGGGGGTSPAVDFSLMPVDGYTGFNSVSTSPPTEDGPTTSTTLGIFALTINLADKFGSGFGTFGGVKLQLYDGSGGLYDAAPSLIGTTAVVPVPAAVWLFGSGLLGLVGIARRKK